MNKKGALELSMQSIIVFVLAIIVMSALVVAIRGILGGITADKITQLSGGTELPRTAATYSDPLTIAESGNSLTLKPLAKNQEFAFDYFNTGKDTSGSSITINSGEYLELYISQCTYYGSDGSFHTIDKTSSNSGLLPKVTSIYPLTKNLPSGDNLGEGKFRVNENGLGSTSANSFDCKIGIYKANPTDGSLTNPNDPLAQKVITITVG